MMLSELLLLKYNYEVLRTQRKETLRITNAAGSGDQSKGEARPSMSMGSEAIELIEG